MRWLISTASILLLTPFSFAADKQFLIAIDCLQGDPLGTRERGTIRSLASPRLTTIEKIEANFVHRGELASFAKDQMLPYELVIQVLPMAVRDGKVSVELTATIKIVDEEQQGRKFTRTMGRTIVDNVPLRANQRHHLGPIFGDQIWVEFTLEEVIPLKNGARPK